MTDHVDLLVLGAGPAGCAAALRAHALGATVVVVEAKPTGARHRTPGETLHPGVEPLFEQLGVADDVRAAGFHRHRGIWVEPAGGGGDRRFEPYGGDANGLWLGFQVDRSAFHALLRRRLDSAGILVHRGSAPGAVILEDGRVCGVHVGERAVRARWTADATGRRAWLSRTLGLPRTALSPPLRVRFGWRGAADPALDGQPVFRPVVDGWDWEAPIGPARSAWVSLRAVKDGHQSPGMDATWAVHRPYAGSGYFLLGDAAVTLDPSSAKGVLRALLCGIYCGHLVAQCAGRIVDERTVAAAYGGWLGRIVDADLTALRAIHGYGTPAGTP